MKSWSTVTIATSSFLSKTRLKELRTKTTSRTRASSNSTIINIAGRLRKSERGKRIERRKEGKKKMIKWIQNKKRTQGRGKGRESGRRREPQSNGRSQGQESSSSSGRAGGGGRQRKRKRQKRK